MFSLHVNVFCLLEFAGQSGNIEIMIWKMADFQFGFVMALMWGRRL